MAPRCGGGAGGDNFSFCVLLHVLFNMNRQYIFRSGTHDLQVWFMVTGLAPHQQAASFLLCGLEGQGLEMVRTIAPRDAELQMRAGQFAFESWLAAMTQL